MTRAPRIGLALSGGGFRAACFGLGCLRALHDRDLLRYVRVISGVSGGSLLAALYAYGPSSFEAFDAVAVGQLARGLQAEIAWRALQPAAVARNLSQALLAAFHGGTAESPSLRSANRTDALAETLASRVFGNCLVSSVTHPDLATVLTAADLRTTNAVRFGSQVSSCSAYGKIVEPVLVAEAVAASAAFPVLLPALERRYTFARSDGSTEVHALQLTDGGVYDNLGLSALEPGRSEAHTPHVYPVDYIVSCDAGTGRPGPGRGHFAYARLRRSYEITHRKVQDAARARLHESHATRRIQGVVHAYLAMPDGRLPVPVTDIVPAAAVVAYPTDFHAMSEADIDLISLRGEQLTRTLLAHYCPDL